MFLFRYYENFSSPLYPLVSTIVTWVFVDRHEMLHRSNYFKVTLIAHANHQLEFLQLYHSLVRFRK
jgi:hypothetical protein